MLRNSIFVIFQGGGLDPVSPPLDPRMKCTAILAFDGFPRTHLINSTINGNSCKTLFKQILKNTSYCSGGKVIAERRPGTGPILLDNIVCTGTETTLKDCKLTWGESQCTHEQDVYIRCTDPGNVLTLKVPIATKVVCYFRLRKCLRSLYSNQCGPRSDCSYRISLFWVHAVYFYT